MCNTIYVCIVSLWIVFEASNITDGNELVLKGPRCGTSVEGLDTSQPQLWLNGPSRSSPSSLENLPSERKTVFHCPSIFFRGLSSTSGLWTLNCCIDIFAKILGILFWRWKKYPNFHQPPRFSARGTFSSHCNTKWSKTATTQAVTLAKIERPEVQLYK